ncbi:polyprenyl synthetase family protein [Allobranchiibius sp. GilTou73]|uniref:polyprenyl synthetase family protein n=1 Tax=Allobranchiibius sp. GilTou73 TaxID=2904523 RepID=UPI001F3B34BD|nr:polyprenyl synthetase family protein [Allobranchiibius sp. GilTou73]UIJ36615.1 polyprenyl synthetase family protein [Allobranchiibius sp. GilTou73]
MNDIGRAPAQTLDETRSLVLPALHKAVDRLDDLERLTTSYHLGWVDAGGDPVSGAGGKAVRPALAVLGARAVGAEPAVAVPGAVAVELVHNFSLVHDDIMDRDRTRRHRPTVWSVWDEATAILTGDAMLSLAHEVLLEEGGLQAAAASWHLARCTRALINGQVLDMTFEQRAEVSLHECRRMAQGKTAALIATSTVIGAVLAGGDADALDALTTYGLRIGLAFQLVDDLLGVWGDPQVTGKSNFSDLQAKKKTLPVCWALGQDGARAARLRTWFTDGPTDPAALARAAGLLEEAGARDWAEGEARRLVASAQAALRGAALTPSATADLHAMADFIAGRKA